MLLIKRQLRSLPRFNTPSAKTSDSGCLLGGFIQTEEGLCLGAICLGVGDLAWLSQTPSS